MRKWQPQFVLGAPNNGLGIEPEDNNLQAFKTAYEMLFPNIPHFHGSTLMISGKLSKERLRG